MPKVVTLCVFLAIVIMSIKKMRSAVLVGIIGGMVLYYLLGLTVDGFYENLVIQFVSPIEAFKEFGEYSLFRVFKEGFDFSAYIETHGNTNLVLTIATTALAFCMVDMFDTLGTLYGASAEAGLLDENGDPIGLEKEMLCDSIGTAVGAVVGTSTITTFVESSAGVAAGGRTGLSSVVTAILFLLCLFIAPLAQYVPSCATAPALIYVGLLMCKNILNIDFKDVRSAATGFITFLMMVVTYSISNGIMLGAITYVIITLLTGKYNKKDIIVTIIAVLGILRFAFIAM